MKQTLSLLIMFLALACTNAALAQTAPGTVTSKKLGWTITAPKGFKSMPQHELDNLMKNGKKAIEAAGIDTPDVWVVDNIAVFKKEGYNMFHAAIEPNHGVPVDSVYKVATSTMYNSFTHMGLSLDTLTTKETVKGKEYMVFNARISTAEGKELMQQKSYFANVKTYAFSASIVSDNEADKQVMIEAFKASVWE